MEFNTFHKAFFSASDGAFSRVTERENFDSQITLTDKEAEIVIRHFGIENINFGNVNSDPQKSSKTFYLYPDFRPISLNLVFPKLHKVELRLYLSSKNGFKPSANEIWFLYQTSNNHLAIGSLPENIWGNLGQDDLNDSEYQEEIERVLTTIRELEIVPGGKIVTSIRNSQTIYLRDPKLAIARFRKTEYKCEVDSSHKTFIAETTKLPFMEAHHFIPMKFQSAFATPLDNFSNVISLCPNCHRGIHHGVVDYKYDLISKIYKTREDMHHYHIDDIAQYYNCIHIPYE